MATVAKLLIELGMNVARLQKDIEQARRTVDRGVRDMRRTLQSLQATFQALAGTAGIGLIGRAMMRNAAEAEQASLRMTAVIRATGGAAGVTRREIDELAESLAASTQFDDDSLRNAASNLMKFGNVHGEVFRGALRLSADLAAFMGKDVADAAQMIGKTLQSPTEGLTMMEREFGKLTEAEERHIRTLVEQGRAVEAQNAVLDLWRKKVGGTAELMNTGLAAAIEGTRKSWNQLLEDLGKTEIFGFVERSLRGIAEILNHIRESMKPATAAEQRGLRINQIQDEIERIERSRSSTRRSPLIDERLAELRRELRELNAEGMRERELAEAHRQQEEMEASFAIAHTGVPKLGGKTTDPAAAAKDLREAEWRVQKAVELEEMAAQDTREAWEAYTKWRVQMEEDLRKQREEGLKSWFETIDAEQEREIEAAAGMMRILEEQAEKTREFARDLGLTFSSAFEDAIVRGDKLRDVLKGIEQDIARIIIRKQITEPLAAAIGGFDFGDFFRGFGGGGASSGPGPAAWAASSESFDAAWHSQDFMGFAGGGSFTVGGVGGTDSQLVAFRATPGERVDVLTPAQQASAGGGEMTVIQHIYAAPGMDERQLAALVNAKIAEAQARQLRSARYGGVWSPSKVEA